MAAMVSRLPAIPTPIVVPSMPTPAWSLDELGVMIWYGSAGQVVAPASGGVAARGRVSGLLRMSFQSLAIGPVGQREQTVGVGARDGGFVAGWSTAPCGMSRPGGSPGRGPAMAGDASAPEARMTASGVN